MRSPEDDGRRKEEGAGNDDDGAAEEEEEEEEEGGANDVGGCEGEKEPYDLRRSVEERAGSNMLGRVCRVASLLECWTCLRESVLRGLSSLPLTHRENLSNVPSAMRRGVSPKVRRMEWVG